MYIGIIINVLKDMATILFTYYNIVLRFLLGGGAHETTPSLTPNNLLLSSACKVNMPPTDESEDAKHTIQLWSDQREENYFLASCIQDTRQEVFPSPAKVPASMPLPYR